jgi:hypothetical protein
VYGSVGAYTGWWLLGLLTAIWSNSHVTASYVRTLDISDVETNLKVLERRIDLCHPGTNMKIGIQNRTGHGMGTDACRNMSECMGRLSEDCTVPQETEKSDP